MFHGVCHMFRPYKAACTCLYTRSRKACRPVVGALLVRKFSNVAAILRLDWARPPPFYTHTRDPFPRRCALRALRNSRVLNSRAARLRVSISTEAISSKAKSSSKVPHLSYAAAASVQGGESPQSTNKSTSVSSHSSTTLNSTKKFNVVLYGVDECPSGTSRSARLVADLESVVSVFATIDSTFQAQALKDCFRLGKYNPAHDKPRPILVKFVKIADVSNIILLSKKRNLHQPYFIKPDMSREQRKQETVLMRKRWNLIQSRIPRNEVKFHNARL